MDTEYFRRAIEYYADEANGWGGQTRLAELYGCKNSYINMIIKKAKKPSYKVQKKFAAILEIPREKLIDIGKKLPEKANNATFSIKLPDIPPPPISLQDEGDKKHAAVIAGFEDKERAIRLNQKLVELEKLAPERLRSLEETLDDMLFVAREKKGLAMLQNQKTGTNQSK